MDFRRMVDRASENWREERWARGTLLWDLGEIAAHLLERDENIENEKAGELPSHLVDIENMPNNGEEM